jgi:putative transposase
MVRSLIAAEIQPRRAEGLNSCNGRWQLEELFVKVNGDQHYSWRAVGHEVDVLETFVSKTRERLRPSMSCPS